MAASPSRETPSDEGAPARHDDDEAAKPAARRHAKHHPHQATHSHVRWVVYLSYLLMAGIFAAATWNSMNLGQRAQRDAAAVLRVSEARADALELARLAAQLLGTSTEREKHLANLSRRLGHSAAAAPVVEQMLSADLTDPAMRRPFDQWRVAHERLREKLSGLTGAALDLPPAENQAQL